MQFAIKTLLALAFVVMASGSAAASSHTAIARELTLAKLTQEVDSKCGTWALPFTKCSTLRSLVSQLYRNPTVATRADLDTLEKLEKLGLEVTDAKGSLASAILDAKLLFAHVVNVHNGVWEDAICGPAPRA